MAVTAAPTTGTTLDAWSGEVGFRTVVLDTTPDAEGTPFRLVVNGVPVFARGLNWIPDDCFPTRVTAERYATRLTRPSTSAPTWCASGAAGIYESDDFYDALRRLGLMVWQDFLFACAAYAEEEPLRSEVEAEAREAVTRLTPHPSLVLWNGNNENIWGYADWGWAEQLDGRDLGVGLLHRAAAEHRRRARRDPALLPGQPVRRCDPTSTPTTRRTAPTPPLGRVERRRLHALPRLPAPVRRRVRLAGARRPGPR